MIPFGEKKTRGGVAKMYLRAPPDLPHGAGSSLGPRGQAQVVTVPPSRYMTGSVEIICCLHHKIQNTAEYTGALLLLRASSLHSTPKLDSRYTSLL